MPNRTIIRPSPLSFGLAMTLGTRSRQEDFACVDGTSLAVLDGLGGHEDGDQASYLGGIGFVEGGPSLTSRLIRANSHLILHRQNGGRKSPMSTIVAAEVLPDAVLFGWQGDSRGYVLCGGKLIQVTADHSDPWSRAVLNTLGGTMSERAEFEKVPRDNITHLMLCSDGISNNLETIHLEDLLRNASDPQSSADEIMTAARASGKSGDNATIIVVAL